MAEGWNEKKRGFKACCLSCMDGKQTCKFFRLIQVAWTGSLSVWICRNIYRWEGPAQTSAFFSLSKEHSGCKGSKKGRDRERSKLQSEFCRKSRHRHSCNTPPHPQANHSLRNTPQRQYVHLFTHRAGWWDVKFQYNIRPTHQLLQSSCPLTPV